MKYILPQLGLVYNQLLTADSGTGEDAHQQQAKRRLAGVEARADLNQIPTTRALDRAEVATIVAELRSIGPALDRAEPAELEQLYAALGLEMVYDPHPKSSTLVSPPSVGVARVSEGGLAH